MLANPAASGTPCWFTIGSYDRMPWFLVYIPPPEIYSNEQSSVIPQRYSVGEHLFFAVFGHNNIEIQIKILVNLFNFECYIARNPAFYPHLSLVITRILFYLGK